MDYNNTLLLVEDDDVDAMIIKRAIKDLKLDCKIQRAENGLAALEILKNTANGISLIILDLNMPLMDGFEFLEKIKEREEFINIPVVVFSTSNYTGDRQLCLELGAKEYFVKPVGFDEYKEMLKVMTTYTCNS